jgi:uncharacterized protein (TIGR02453 family)
VTNVDSAFSGFRPEAIQFLADYERLLKEPMERLCEALADRFAARGIPLRADPKRSPFRIYRDTRFSRDKSPYKSHVSASFPYTGPGGPGWAAEGPHGSGGYFHFQPGEMFAGGGMWMPEKPRLDAFRRAIVDEPDRVAAVLDEPAFVAMFGGAHGEGDDLKRVPLGYPPDHPMAERLRWKSVVFGRRQSDQEVCSASLPDDLADAFEVAVPVFAFLATLG